VGVHRAATRPTIPSSAVLMLSPKPLAFCRLWLIRSIISTYSLYCSSMCSQWQLPYCSAVAEISFSSSVMACSQGIEKRLDTVPRPVDHLLAGKLGGHHTMHRLLGMDADHRYAFLVGALDLPSLPIRVD